MKVKSVTEARLVGKDIFEHKMPKSMGKIVSATYSFWIWKALFLGRFINFHLMKFAGNFQRKQNIVVT